jgi:hypothetical protein
VTNPTDRKLTGYLLALAAVIPVTGWTARRFDAATAPTKSNRPFRVPADALSRVTWAKLFGAQTMC